MSAPAKTTPPTDIMESVLLKGDLAQLTPAERLNYYHAVCQSLGLNPLTQPFAYMQLQGRTQLYAKRDAADQLRRLRNISLEIISQGLVDELYSVHVQATDSAGRKDEDIGVVPLPNNTKGEFRANMILKAVTKAKRRVTLSICGLGFLDESEVESIAEAKNLPGPSSKSLADEMDDEIPEHADAASSISGSASAAAVSLEPSPSQTPAAATTPMSLEDMAREAAKRGPAVLQAFFKLRSSDEKRRLRQIEEELVKLYPQREVD
jgi:hypothetical protein